MRNGEFEPIVSEAISGVTEEGATVKVDDEADSHSVTGVRVDDLISEVEMPKWMLKNCAKFVQLENETTTMFS
jgi:hypothetical protein